MPTNQYFKSYNSEIQQDLVDSLITEVVQINGTDVLYLPRTIVNRDDILNEDSTNKFTMAYEVEMYINTTDGFGGSGDQLTKFGLDVQDEIIFTVSKKRFAKEVPEPGVTAPREGDLIYLPMNKGLFQITFVEHEKPFYTLGKNYVYEITCEKFVYSNEKFEIPAAQQGALFEKLERQYVSTITLEVGGLAADGNYSLGEEVYQGVNFITATAKGYVGAWDVNTNKLSIYNEIGTFTTEGGVVKGNSSETERAFVSRDDMESLNRPYQDNKEFETDGGNILDFSELDPWAEGEY